MKEAKENPFSTGRQNFQKEDETMALLKIKKIDEILEDVKKREIERNEKERLEKEKGNVERKGATRGPEDEKTGRKAREKREKETTGRKVGNAKVGDNIPREEPS